MSIVSCLKYSYLKNPNLFILKTLFTFYLLLLITVNLDAQERQKSKLLLSGTIYGYNFDPAKKLLKKDKEIELEGSIDKVSVNVFKGSKKVSSTITNGNGDFSIYVPLEDQLKVILSKNGYAKSIFLIDMKGAPDDIANNGLVFNNMELILNSFVSEETNSDKPFGKLYYNSGTKSIAFNSKDYKEKQTLFGKKENNTPLNLMEGAVEKNISNNKEVNNSEVEEEIIEEINGGNNAGSDNSTSIDDKNENEEEIIIVDQNHFILSSKIDLDNLSLGDIDNRSNELKKAWDQLEKDKLIAVTPEDFLIIQARENLLLAAEKELEDARKYIDLQNEEISAQRNKIVLMIILLVILAVFALYIYRGSKIKSRLNRELAEKNKKITASINYAYRIQQSILLTQDEVQQILPDSFIFYKPLDIVSGDFYWISEVKDKIILAVVDCTGHGVPGAFMSLIGNTLLNEIINEKKITDPAKILDELHTGIVKSLRQNDSEMNNQDGMDMSLCVIDRKSSSIEFAGAMNPLYIVEDNKVVCLEASLRGIGGVSKRKKKEINFERASYNYTQGTSIYMTSDGFMDQFGGPDKTKFNLPRFKELLLNLDKSKFENQKNEFDKALEGWKGNEKQIDDILVIGVKL